jgi:ACT domain-containing protein
MSVIKYLDRIKHMDELIRRKATGSPDKFAKKVGLSRSGLMKYIKLLKEMNAPLEYDQNRQSYYYIFPCKLKIGYETRHLDHKELVNINKKSLKKICEIVSV